MIIYLFPAIDIKRVCIKCSEKDLYAYNSLDCNRYSKTDRLITWVCLMTDFTPICGLYLGGGV